MLNQYKYFFISGYVHPSMKDITTLEEYLATPSEIIDAGMADHGIMELANSAIGLYGEPTQHKQAMEEGHVLGLQDVHSSMTDDITTSEELLLEDHRMMGLDHKTVGSYAKQSQYKQIDEQDQLSTTDTDERTQGAEVMELGVGGFDGIHVQYEWLNHNKGHDHEEHEVKDRDQKGTEKMQKKDRKAATRQKDEGKLERPDSVQHDKDSKNRQSNKNAKAGKGDDKSGKPDKGLGEKSSSSKSNKVKKEEKTKVKKEEKNKVNAKAEKRDGKSGKPDKGHDEKSSSSKSDKKKSHSEKPEDSKKKKTKVEKETKTKVKKEEKTKEKKEKKTKVKQEKVSNAKKRSSGKMKTQSGKSGKSVSKVQKKSKMGKNAGEKTKVAKPKKAKKHKGGGKTTKKGKRGAKGKKR